MVLADLLENDLHSVQSYINTTNAVTSISTINKYIKVGNIIPIVADWPGQIYLRTVIF